LVRLETFSFVLGIREIFLNDCVCNSAGRDTSKPQGCRRDGGAPWATNSHPRESREGWGTRKTAAGLSSRGLASARRPPADTALKEALDLRCHSERSEESLRKGLNAKRDSSALSLGLRMTEAKNADLKVGATQCQHRPPFGRVSLLQLARR